jgi:hypothetical protein
VSQIRPLVHEFNGQHAAPTVLQVTGVEVQLNDTLNAFNTDKAAGAETVAHAMVWASKLQHEVH